MENVDEQLKTSIQSVLNPVSEDTVNGIIQAVKYAGLESPSDLKFVQEEDLILVLKPIQRRKLLKAWSKQTVPAAVTSSDIPLDMSSALWPFNKHIKLLQVYKRYKRELVCSGVENLNVWSKIAAEVRGDSLKFHCDGSQCCKKIEELRSEYERSENPNIHNHITAVFYDAAKMAFDTTEDLDNFSVEQPSTKKLQSCGKASKDYCLKLLQVYSKYKTEFSSPDIEELSVWEKIAKEMRENFLYDCGGILCRFDLLELQQQYRDFKRNGIKSENIPYFFDEGQRAFETTDYFVEDCEKKPNLKEKMNYLCTISSVNPTVSVSSVTTTVPVANFSASDFMTHANGTGDKKSLNNCEIAAAPAEMSNTIPLQKCKWTRKNCLVLLEVYKKCKKKSDVKDLNMWKKIAEKVRAKLSLNCNEFQCRFFVRKLLYCKLELRNI